MMLTRTPSSDIALGKLIVAEGPPGGGKTSAIAQLAGRGHTVIGEYATDDGATIPIAEHPDVDDDSAHQRNWLIKQHHAARALPMGTVWMDRDWITALAYAYGLPDRTLLSTRAAWAYTCLEVGQLAVADTYVVIHVEPQDSLQRRCERLTAGHPWSNRAGLERLAPFYADPVSAVRGVHSGLADLLAAATWRHLHDHTVDQVVAVLELEGAQ